MLTVTKKKVILSGGHKGGVRYSYCGGFSGAPNSTTIAGSVDLGLAAPDRLVVVATACQNNGALTSVTVGGVLLTTALSNATPTPSCFLSYGLVPNVTGSQVVSIVCGAAFNQRDVLVWTANGLSSNIPKNVSTTTTNATAAVINVTAGDILFTLAAGINAALLTFIGHSTENPASQRSMPNVGGANAATTGDWIIGNTNASFSFTAGQSTNTQQMGISFR